MRDGLEEVIKDLVELRKTYFGVSEEAYKHVGVAIARLIQVKELLLVKK